MDKETILNFYWDIFLSHVCEFYPLEREFIEYYEYELAWYSSLSKNRVIKWDTAFIEKYQERFSWGNLAWNDSVPWTIDTIDRFNKKFYKSDWYYLGQNKNIIVTEELLKKFQKKLQIADNNPSWTDKLKEKYKQNLWPPYKHDKVKEIQLDNLKALFNNLGWHYDNNQILYEKIFLPIIQNSSLDEIFKNKFDYSQRYYYFSPFERDDKGITPEFIAEGENPFFDIDALDGPRGLFNLKEKLVLVNGTLTEGPNRLYEVANFSNSWFTTIMISENVKKVLEQFKLPKHIFHPLEIKPKKITSTTKYFILHLELDRLTKDLDFSSQNYYYTDIESFSRKQGEVKDKIKSFEEYEMARKKLHTGFDFKLYPYKYNVTSNFDVYSYSIHDKFIVNQYVKDALERKFPGQMSFKSAQLLNIKIDQKDYDAKKDRVIDFKNISKVHYGSSAESLHYYDKKKRLEKKDVAFKSQLNQKDGFSAKEKELNVLFSNTIKKKILGKKINIKGYELLPINEFYIQNDYSETYPESYKAVIIAQNEYGDSIGLLLEKESDHNLQNSLYYFLHEEGEVKKV